MPSAEPTQIFKGRKKSKAGKSNSLCGSLAPSVVGAPSIINTKAPKATKAPKVKKILKATKEPKKPKGLESFHTTVAPKEGVSLGQNPGLNSSDIASSSTGCVDSPLHFKVVSEGSLMEVACEKVATEESCKELDIATHCPHSCGLCNQYQCVDSMTKFSTQDGWKQCEWVRRRFTNRKCAIEGIRETCRATCNYENDEQSLSCST